MAGKVYLVGAGPGDPELLTLKGRRALEEADVVVYDRLANPRLLEFARSAAERIYVGKAAQNHAMTQEEINALLLERAAAGSIVCRLKGGDPFLFGRGGEEAEALAAGGIEWEYVPGVTSAIAAPGYAGIPVTHRGLGASFAVVTGHEDPAKGASTVRWEHLSAGVDTLVCLMGAERLPAIAAALLAHGRDPGAPAAVVSCGSRPEQRTVQGRLDEIVERCREAAGGDFAALAPAVLIVGEVAALRERLAWFDTRPLFGKRIAVTRPRDQAGDLASRIEQEGGWAIFCPSIRIRRLPDADLSPLDQPADWVVFTSANGIYSLTATLKERGKDLRLLGGARIAAIGPETARALEESGLRVDFVPRRYVAEQVAAEFPEPVRGKRILIPRAREAREVLPELWRGEGAEVRVVPVYESVPDDFAIADLEARLEAAEVDAITFTASSTVRSLLKRLPPAALERARIVCIGPVTADTARAAGLRVDAVADTFTTAGLMQALRQLFRRD